MKEWKQFECGMAITEVERPVKKETTPPLKPLAKLGGTREEILARSELAREIFARKEAAKYKKAKRKTQLKEFGFVNDTNS